MGDGVEDFGDSLYGRGLTDPGDMIQAEFSGRVNSHTGNLYGDIFDADEQGESLGAATMQESLRVFQRKCTEQESELEKLRARVKGLEADNKKLTEERGTLMRNISTLYLTAVEEIKRLRDRLSDARRRPPERS